MLDEDDVLYIDRVQGFRRRQQIGGPDVKAGLRVPAYCTALGKVLLAHLPERERRDELAHTELKRLGPNTITTKGMLRDELAQVREEGIAVEDQELAPGRIAIAAPVFNEAGEITAAIDLTAGVPGIAVEELAGGLGPHLISTADRIASRLGHRREGEVGRD